MQHEVCFATEFKRLVKYFPKSILENNFSTDLFSAQGPATDSGKQPVIFLNPVTGTQAWHLMTWGCMPFDLTDALISSRQWAFMLYTPAERIFGDTKSYWHKIRDQRCLVPVKGIYVHRTVENVHHRIPYFVHLPDQPVFFLPGLYSADEAIDTITRQKIVRFVFTIISSPPNSLMKHLCFGQEKNRTIPLLLPFSLACQWLEHKLSEAGYRAILEFEMPADALQAWPIYSAQPE
ncbi:MAG: SOS response-associated peptidase family protein [Williamsia sp.]|nr:SOS response-associated peptidase family protein [Williamsia sp.]